MNTRRKGCYRDKAILEAIEDRKALDTDQITALLFKDIAQARRKAQERLLKLYKGGRVKRCRTALTEPYCYYTDRKHGRLEHLLALNWVYVWLINGLKAWEQIHCFSYEVNYKILQSDAFVGIRNTVTGKFKFYFVELDRSSNDFDKVSKYNQLYRDGGHGGQWWVKLSERFPGVLVVTTTVKRAAHIGQRIKNENTAGLEFKVMLLSEIKEGLI